MAEETLSNQELARKLLMTGGAATLATLGPGGEPFASYVVTAPTADGAPLMLLSRLAEHTKNIDRDPRAQVEVVSTTRPAQCLRSHRLASRDQPSCISTRRDRLCYVNGGGASDVDHQYQRNSWQCGPLRAICSLNQPIADLNRVYSQ